MHHFTIRDVENLSGIKAHTLRMWEHRYGLCICKRRESLHRYYDNEDLKRILRIAHLYRNGYKISAIAQLSAEQINEQAAKKMHSNENESIINRLLQASVDYNDEAFEDILETAARNIGFENTVTGVVYPFLDKIGLLWLTGHVLPAHEHFCSHLVEKTILAAINDLVRASPGGNRYLLFTPRGEEHELSLLFVHYLIRKKGCATTFIGKNASTEVLKAYCQIQPVTHLYFHLISNFTNCTPAVYLQNLASTFPDKTIVASGPAFKNLETWPKNVQLLRSLQELTDYNFGG